MQLPALTSAPFPHPMTIIYPIVIKIFYITLEISFRVRNVNSLPQSIFNCDIKAGKIINPEFIAKCPPGCQDIKYRVYGTNIYASFSTVCSAAIHSGATDNSGGKILVQKVAGQSGYRGSFSNGIRSLSLPRWRESFIVSEGKPKKGVTYPSTLEYASSKSSPVKTGKYLPSTSMSFRSGLIPIISDILTIVNIFVTEVM
uniref:LCCL domain-containing protein n=1 Tax=Gopherus evgoodei TaxID=1825980 RepID=A0A8C4WCF8_9SAUR